MQKIVIITNKKLIYNLWPVNKIIDPLDGIIFHELYVIDTKTLLYNISKLKYIKKKVRTNYVTRFQGHYADITSRKDKRD